ncbi:MAG: hypothetical protein ABIO04_05120 [Ferruginibacter sp.]
MIETNSGAKPIKVIFRELNEKEYEINIIGYLDQLKPFLYIPGDTLKATAFMSNVSQWQFLNIEYKGQTYISQLRFENEKLSILPLAEYFTAKYIKSDSQLRTAVEFHFRTRLSPIFEQSFCMRNMVRVN